MNVAYAPAWRSASVLLHCFRPVARRLAAFELRFRSGFLLSRQPIQHQCDLTDEYSNGQYDCNDFTNKYPGYSVYGRGNEYGKHNGYTYLDSRIRSLHTSVQDFLIRNGVYWPQLTLTSGYRCPKGNKAVYDDLGKPEVNSRHKYGRAIDVKFEDSDVWTPGLKLAIRNYNRDLYPGTDSYIDSWVHLSVP